MGMAIVEAGFVYLGLGAVVALLFVLLGIGRVDQGARGWSLGRIGFRLMVLPGCVLLWPLVALRWVQGRQPPDPMPPALGDEASS
ncbi:MAG: hypothetical protein AAGH15_15195 [Myxococcota bacterium]